MKNKMIRVGKLPEIRQTHVILKDLEAAFQCEGMPRLLKEVQNIQQCDCSVLKNLRI